MEEILVSQKMEELDLINSLERISSKKPNRILKIEGFILKKKKRKTRNNNFQGV